MSARSSLSLSILSALALTALAVPAMAQQSGGLQISPARPGGPVGLARPLQSAPMPLITAQQMQNGMTASDHQTADQNMITSLKGDPGFLSGFQFGTPMAASSQQVQTLSYNGGYRRRQQAQGLPDDRGYRRRQQAESLPDGGGYAYRRQHGGRGSGPVIIDNGGPLAITSGNGNVVQLSSSQGAAGPVAQQQVVNLPGSVAGGAVNLAGSARR